MHRAATVCAESDLNTIPSSDLDQVLFSISEFISKDLRYLKFYDMLANTYSKFYVHYPMLL